MAGSKPGKLVTPSSNWLALQKKIGKYNTTKESPNAEKSSKISSSTQRPTKRRKLTHASSELLSTSSEPHTFPRGVEEEPEKTEDHNIQMDDVQNGESLAHLRRMVLGKLEHSASHREPGKYIALDCEMVGVGIDGAESSLARVSLVNYHGFVLLDVFVRQRERVVDYRTEFSGVRPSDMVHARPFEEVQKEVATLLKDRILVGHAVHNDLHALLLSHPRPQTRDTQTLAHKHKVSRGRRPALRHLTKQELGLTIQEGEHSSVTDARATMALFRLHRRTWENNVRQLPPSRHHSRGSTISEPSMGKKRPRSESTSTSFNKLDEGKADVNDIPSTPPKIRHGNVQLGIDSNRRSGIAKFPGGGRKGVSSGLSTVVNRVGGVMKAKGPRSRRP